MTDERLKELKSKSSLTLDECNELMRHYGGSLDLEGCTALTSLPDGLHVGGYLDLEGCASLTSLPEGLFVGYNLYLEGCTALTSLPEGLCVGGNIVRKGTCIPDTELCKVKRLTDGDYVEGEYLYADKILTHVKSKKTCGRYTIYYGKIKHMNVVYDGTYYAHCANIRDGIRDIKFKHAKDRCIDEYNDLTLDSIIKKDDAIVMYRVITGACQQGTQRFIDSLGDTIRDEYTISEIIELTKGRYGSDRFKEFFTKETDC